MIFNTQCDSRSGMNIRLIVMALMCSILPTGTLSAKEPADPFRPPAISTTEVPVVPPSLIERLRQYQNVRSAGFAGWSPDGKGILIQTRFGNASQLHQVRTPLGAREQLTFFDEPTSGMFIPKDKTGSLLLSKSQGGNENYQIYYFNRRTGKATLLTDGKSRNRLGPVLKDGSRMIVSSNRRNGRDTDLYVADTRKPGQMKMILQTKGEYWYPADWSPDRFTLLINRYVSINESYPALLDILTGEKTDIPTPDGKTASFGAMAFSADGKSIYTATDSGGEFRHLARIDLKSKKYTWITRDIPWNVDSVAVEPKSGLVAFTLNVNGASSLHFMRDPQGEETKTLFPRGESYVLERDKPIRVNIPLGQIGSLEFSPDGNELGFTLSRPNAPADAFSLSLQTGKLTQWTKSEVGGLDTSKFVSPELLLYPTFDRVPDPENGKRVPRLIPAFLFKPKSASKEKPAAVLINIHGGPESQYRPRLSTLDQFFVNELGIAVIRPNVRGSAGYGKRYLKLDNGELREDSVRDIGKLLDWIKTQPDLDSSRVAVMGGSYGGYMVLASLTHYSNRIKAGVDIVGIASFTTFLKNTSAYRRDLRRAEYGDERDPKMQAVFARINPTSSAHKITSALYVAHGRNDPRVPFSEAEQIVAKVRKNGKKVWTVYADNEGHGFRKKENRDYLYATIVMFLMKHLK
ncbi:MAG: S9 family peptidase [Planctomycetaceae bacterium]